ncbi:MerR family transcriptional regulator [Streptomyces telluris]|uniref:MerR family transcriptional regulator n=1 Tax=Streptomyces telluris TaxID=2720021 RepID=A0A9X2RLY8_9ACTN|nr:MerR family transcriptional regulator [Streptomyces telluris]MCQ8771387.1 MerR family transcriptional regulator [Streptomyces telluris]NJP82005.1 MerR family transcriptional regulator [Streptomyces telluris]
MRISPLVERTGVPVSTLRFHESVGLLPAERTPAGYRAVPAPSSLTRPAVDDVAWRSASVACSLRADDAGERAAQWQ